MDTIRQTPSQTVGPFFAYSLTATQYGYPYNSLMGATLLGSDAPGERIYISGRVFDGAGNPVPDAVIELWQANASGHYQTAPISAQLTDEKTFTGFGRLGTGTQPGAMFRFETVKPGRVRSGGDQSGGDDDDQVGSAPHINVMLFMRGSLRTLYTRLYFSDEAAANEQDRLLNAIPADRRGTLIAHKTDSPHGSVYQFDIWLQGDRETVFFDL